MELTEFDEIMSFLINDEKEVPQHLNHKLKKKITAKYRYNKLMRAIPMSAVACIAVGFFLVSAIYHSEELTNVPQPEVKEKIVSEEMVVKPEIKEKIISEEMVVKPVVEDIKSKTPEKTDKTKKVEKKQEEITIESNNNNEGISVASHIDNPDDLIENNIPISRGRMVEDVNILGLELSAKDVTPRGLTLVYTQSDGNITGELQTGSQYLIEEEIDGQWEKVQTIIDEEYVAWTMEAYHIEKNQSTQMNVDWSYLYGELSEGSYRIKKEITDFRGTNNYDNYDYYAYFEIK